jgi:hypothetical protein
MLSTWWFLNLGGQTGIVPTKLSNEPLPPPPSRFNPGIIPVSFSYRSISKTMLVAGALFVTSFSMTLLSRSPVVLTQVRGTQYRISRMMQHGQSRARLVLSTTARLVLDITVCAVVMPMQYIALATLLQGGKVTQWTLHFVSNFCHLWLE